MAEREDGGAAFPVAADVEAIRQGFYPQDGMSLRDYFAGQALIAFLSNETWTRGLDESCRVGEFKAALAEHCYEMASEMLKARKAGQ